MAILCALKTIRANNLNEKFFPERIGEFGENEKLHFRSMHSVGF